MRFRLGLIGLGPSWATRHRPALHALSSRFQVRAVCDPVAHRAEQIASELGARPMEGFRALAACEDVDAVMLLSARWFGALPIFAACDYGKAVYCGASVNLEAQQAAALRDRVRAAGIAFMAEFPKRLAPATTRLQELMATRLGRPRLIFCNERYASRGDDGDGPANMRRLVEMVDWCCYVAGREVRCVTGAAHDVTAAPAPENEVCGDYSLMTLDFHPGPEDSCGVMAQIACGSYVPNNWSDAASFRRPAELQVVCERGIAFLDLPNRLVWFDDAGQHTEALDAERPVGEQLLMQFHRAVSSLVLKSSGLEDAYRAAALVIAGQTSHREGRRIEIT
ncbi:Inositol 2-dehydrogenase/D-chiro-inositol 3-dehydrogenase [Posidoniimonas polymericola]|uniref:Inositol 2-dehydrogenase/D-chiro-inositol 3-dehydrogenase n=1 Tax=Posidoniimonas polymericola TaxID=2528002 RepID=A0A5C5YLT7_9BACT|nr:Gfo/Idh/MocA family oxidoreductase [Posidoniimonas polymericola]TWT75872.1 Inositol 2-dehydrogenase/D-chiro-inositol 3-dehydrogenase [Posidoniimonas polymericola]